MKVTGFNVKSNRELIKRVRIKPTKPDSGILYGIPPAITLPLLLSLEAWLLSAISARKHGGQSVNEFFIYSEDITLSSGYLKGWRIFKMTVFKAVMNRKRSGYVDWPVGQID